MTKSPVIAPVYRGRFAPSPTGALHFGSLIAAVGSFLQARSRDGEWLVRIENLDPPRSVAGAADSILRTLEAFGLFWDDNISYQSLRQKDYDDAIDQLALKGAVYACSCTRSEIADSSALGIDGPVYSGTCRNSVRTARTLRVRTDDVKIIVNDLIQGEMRWDLARQIGDFIVRRADGLYAYQLAVVVDDAAQKITEVVRGADLLHSTPRQVHLQRILGLPTPAYAHLPVATNAFGEKLSKQTLAAAISADQPVPILCEALVFLGQNPPPELRDCDLESVWHWAISSWKTFKVPRVSPAVADSRFT
ncbi:MAG: tRNA glutamyl-Q(34) synthetase GluQRS [Acidiferrobacterales bacterium]